MQVSKVKYIFLTNIRNYCDKIKKCVNNKTIIKNNNIKMKYLNVAEKNDAAKTIAGLLSKGTSVRREGLSRYNKIYEFQTNVCGTNADMIMTSVSGHLLNHAFIQSFKHWNGCDPIALFDAPIIKICPDDFIEIKKTIQREIVQCNALIIWTDCDREGENIGFEIINVCKEIKPNIQIYRAKFSEITAAGIRRALNNLGPPDELQSLAVDVRIELDLRIGAAFTRFQTLRFQNIFPSLREKKLVSYGSCQIPTLGFVAQRYKEIENFVPQKFWKLKLIHTMSELTVEFNWDRNRFFDKQCCEALFMLCQANPEATIIQVVNKPKNKWRPLPMDTIELEKVGSRKLKINAKETMTIAEKLYTKGFISYPRTETNIFSSDINLRSLVEQQSVHPNWGTFATKVLDWGPDPRKGTKSDQAHPPIHPTKYTNELSGNEYRVYELICRHFLACVSKDATGAETIVNVTVADEQFNATGLCIHELNYLEVYIYDKWNAKEIHNYEIGKKFIPTDLSMSEGSTTAPSMLTEAELIALMDKHGIGTDATHAEHINTVKEREYIGEINGGYLAPGNLGMGLVEGYDAMKLTLAQPKLRADLEKDLKLICSGQRNSKDVLHEQIEIYKKAYRVITQEVRSLDQALAARLNETPLDIQSSTSLQQHQLPQQSFKEILKCPKCNRFSMILKTKKDDVGRFFISCLGWPECKHAIWLMDIIKEIIVTDDVCPKCGPGYNKVTLKFKHQSVLGLLNATSNSYTNCLVCDNNLRNVLNIPTDSVKRNNITVNNNNSYNNNNINNNNSNNSNSNNNVRNNNNSIIRPINTTIRNTNTPSAYNTFNNNSNSNTNNNRNIGGWGTSSLNDNNSNTNNRFSNRNFINNNTSATTNTNRNDNNNNNDNRRRDNNIGGGDDVEVNCKCNIKALKLTVKKEGPNTGRKFYTCENKSCNFFQWFDNNNNSDGNMPSSSNNTTTTSWSQNRGANDNDRGTSSNSRATLNNKSKRKCGICKREGHTRAKCPRRPNAYDDNDN